MKRQKVQAFKPQELKAMSELQIAKMLVCRMELLLDGKDHSDQALFESHWQKRGFADMELSMVETLLKNVNVESQEKAPEMCRFVKVTIKNLEKYAAR